MQKTLKPSEIAQMCDVHHRTVSRWIAQNRLKGYKLPGRGNYRVQLDDFMLFLNRQNMPIPEDLRQFQVRLGVLVIDDEEAIVRALSRLFNRAGYEVFTAKDGFEAGVKLLQHRPILMTLDLSMPGMNGFEVLEFIQEHRDLQQTKVMVVSGLADSELARAKELGADKVVRKPFANDEIIGFAEQVLRKMI